jgi:exodeoxyribonuclease VII small subunit
LTQPSERQNPAGVSTEEPYDAIVARLERVVGELEGGVLTLEQSVEKFAEGVKLAREASRKLDEAEKRVETLVRSADGDLEAVPFESDDRGPGTNAGR